MDMLGILGGPQEDPKTAPKWIKKFFSREKMKENRTKFISKINFLSSCPAKMLNLVCMSI